MKRIAVLISGSGSDLQSVIDRIDAGGIDGRIEVVISSNAKAFGLERAKRAGIPTRVYAKADFASLEEMYADMVTFLSASGVELVVLAGYMSILTPNIVRAFPNAIINIHPALIPSFCGKGYYGLRVHEAALAYGVKLSGCTVHFVNEEPDGGPIILQESVPVLEDDTPETLQQRILEAEHRLLPDAVALFCADRLSVHGRIVRIGKEGK